MISFSNPTLPSKPASEKKENEKLIFAPFEPQVSVKVPRSLQQNTIPPTEKAVLKSLGSFRKD